MGDLFARRHGHRVRREIVIRDDAPPELRRALVPLLHDMGLTYGRMREIICPLLHTVPNPDNWSEIPNLRNEVIDLLHNCPWYSIYDVCEASFRDILHGGFGVGRVPLEMIPAEEFPRRLNELFEEFGIDRQMVDGQIVVRGPEEFEHAVNDAVERIQQAGHRTPKQELEEARKDLSRRPEPDITGTVQHCIAALECTARIVSADERATLGVIIERHAAEMGIPRPLDTAIQQMWGYACERARHLREGRVLSREEAELILTISSGLISYLLQRNLPR
jgi:AbiJ N-terminal domain 4